MEEKALKITGLRYIQEQRFEPFYTFLYLYFQLDEETFKVKIRRDDLSWLLVSSGVKNNPYNLFGLTDEWDSINYEDYFKNEFTENDLKKVVEYVIKTKNSYDIINTKTKERLKS